MGLKSFLFDGHSEKGNRFFKNILKFLDNPKRLKYNDPYKLLKASGIQPGQTVLEIGCGSGFFTLPASKLLDNNSMLYSTDIHPMAVAETQKKVDALKLDNVIVRKEDAMNLSFEENMFDLVLLYGVVPAPFLSMEDVSKEIYRVLKPHGVYAIWTMAPFWSPRAALYSATFEILKKHNGVFRLQKN